LDLEALRAKHGTVFQLEAGGRVAAFRPMTFDEARTLGRQIERVPGLAFELGVSACAACLIDGAEAFEAICEESPLALDYDDGLAGTLMQHASREAHESVKLAIRKWRGADRNLAEVADSLLAFKAYTGGEPCAAARAGALHAAEGLDNLKGLFKLVLGYMRAISKKRG
jgi:hypothetical protein